MPDDITTIVRRMAEREASAHFLRASFEVSARVKLRTLRCPWCGADDEAPWMMPLRGWETGYDWAPESAPVAVLTALGCERVTARSLLPLAVLARRSGATTFNTRAATWAQWHTDGTSAHQMLSLLDATERWAEGPDLVPAGGSVPLTLPAAVRVIARGSEPYRDTVSTPHFVHPHCFEPGLAELNEFYLDTRLSAVQRHLDHQSRLLEVTQ